MNKPYIYIIGIALALTPTASRAQNVLSPATSIAVHSIGHSPAKSQAVSSQKLSVFVTIDSSVASWQSLGITPIVESGNTATARLTIGEIQALAKKKGVKYIQLTSGVSQMLDVARSEAGIDDIQKGTSLPQAYTGKGVVVGIVDAGFDYLHSAFRNPADGSLRIKRVWEQNTESLSGAAAPEKFGYGVELTTPELITASQGDTGDNSHGTHVAGIAAGSDDYKDGAYVGNAPDADIVLVALDLGNTNSANISDAVKYIFDYADEVDKPCVVNLSLGNHNGPHDGTSSFDVITDGMQKEGRLIVGAAGNHRTDKFHIDRTFASADDAPLKTFVVYKNGLSAKNVGGTIEIWGEKGTEFTVDLAAYNTFSKSNVSSATVYPADGVKEVSFDRYATGTWNVSSEVSPLNGKPHVVLTSALTSVRSNYAIALTVTPKSGGRVNIWADNSYLGLDSKSIEGFSAPDASSSTLAEIGGTGHKILTVGSYTTRNEYTTNSGTKATLSETVGDISSFSSCGPTADGRLKPEIMAPGCLVISAVSNNDASGTLMYADYCEKNGRNNLYGYMQGTSMSSPFVAGIVATWLQAYPQLSPDKLHEIVASTARKDKFTPAEADSNWGYGKINAMAGLRKCLDLATAGCKSIDNAFDGSVSVVGGNVVITFPHDTRAVVNVAGLAGQLLLRKDLGMRSAGDTVSLVLPQHSSGIYMLSVETAAGNESYKITL